MANHRSIDALAKEFASRIVQEQRSSVVAGERQFVQIARLVKVFDAFTIVRHFYFIESAACED